MALLASFDTISLLKKTRMHYLKARMTKRKRGKREKIQRWTVQTVSTVTAKRAQSQELGNSICLPWVTGAQICGPSPTTFPLCSNLDQNQSSHTWISNSLTHSTTSSQSQLPFLPSHFPNTWGTLAIQMIHNFLACLRSHVFWSFFSFPLLSFLFLCDPYHPRHPQSIVQVSLLSKILCCTWKNTQLAMIAQRRWMSANTVHQACNWVRAHLI